MLAHGPYPQTHDALELLSLRLSSQQIVREIQGRHHGDAVEADHFAAVANLTHLAVQELGRGEQCRLVLGRAGDMVFLLEDPDRDVSEHLAHEACSMLFKRLIIASTRPRTCSFLCSKVARSATSASCRWRSDWFSSCSCRQMTTSSSRRFSNRRNSRSKR